MRPECSKKIRKKSLSQRIGASDAAGENSGEEK